MISLANFAHFRLLQKQQIFSKEFNF